jgi:hypothetical protein
MKERLIVIPFYFSGTSASAGTVIYVTPDPMTFHSGAVWANSVAGGTVIVQYNGTAQGTATLYTNAAKSGTAWNGTAALGASSLGTLNQTMKIPKNGSVIITAAATSATQFSGHVSFLVGE